MREIKAYLQYPWAFPDSPYYSSLVNNPPKKVYYLNSSKQIGAITSPLKFKSLTKLKVGIRRFAYFFKLNVLNAWRTSSKEDFDLIHCAHCLSKNTNKPWVADIESYWSLFIGNPSDRLKKKALNYLTKNNCKKIMPWTNYTKQKIIKEFPEIKDKVETIYPAINLNKVSKSKEYDVIYAARDFKLKGGEIALEVLDRLRKEGFRTIAISDISDEIKESYPLLNIKSLLPKKDLFELMSKSKIFLYPSFMDTFGFSLIESMSFGVPSIALKTPLTCSVEEIVENNKNGFLIETFVTHRNLKENSNEKERLIKEIFNKVLVILKSKRIYKKMSKNCLENISKGKFSIKHRNKQLRKIYEEALE